jgi:hypothetical protein
MSLSDQLYGHVLRTTSEGRLDEAGSRRAVGALYYALFHLISEVCVAALVGTAHAGTQPWTRVYRAIDHGRLRLEFERLLKGQGIEEVSDGAAVIELAQLFIELQRGRHAADYDPEPFPLDWWEVVLLSRRFGVVERAVKGLNAQTQRDLATRFLFKDRK